MNCENIIFNNTIVILQLFSLHLLTVCNSTSRKRGRYFLKAKAVPVPQASIEPKPSLKLLSVTFQSDPCNWDLHLDNILSKASSRLYILSVCKFYGLPLDHLHLLFTSLILPIFTYAVEVLKSHRQAVQENF